MSSATGLHTVVLPPAAGAEDDPGLLEFPDHIVICRIDLMGTLLYQSPVNVTRYQFDHKSCSPFFLKPPVGPAGLYEYIITCIYRTKEIEL